MLRFVPLRGVTGHVPCRQFEPRYHHDRRTSSDDLDRSQARAVVARHQLDDAHTAMLTGVAEVLAGMKDDPPGTVLFIFRPAEEGSSLP